MEKVKQDDVKFKCVRATNSHNKSWWLASFILIIRSPSILIINAIMWSVVSGKLDEQSHGHLKKLTNQRNTCQD